MTKKKDEKYNGGSVTPNKGLKPDKKPFLDYINAVDNLLYGCGCPKKEGKKLCPKHGRI